MHGVGTVEDSAGTASSEGMSAVSTLAADLLLCPIKEVSEAAASELTQALLTRLNFVLLPCYCDALIDAKNPTSVLVMHSSPMQQTVIEEDYSSVLSALPPDCYIGGKCISRTLMLLLGMHMAADLMMRSTQLIACLFPSSYQHAAWGMASSHICAMQQEGTSRAFKQCAACHCTAFHPAACQSCCRCCPSYKLGRPSQGSLMAGISAARSARSGRHTRWQ